MFNIIDAVIILGLLSGIVIGFKKGIIESAVTFCGTIIVIVLAFFLKNPLSSLLYNYLPFFKFGGSLQGVTVINILIYEALAFLIACAILGLGLRLLIKISGIIEKFLKATIVLGIPSRLLGAVFGLLESFLIIFVILFVAGQLNFTRSLVTESKLADKIVSSTPGLSKGVGKAYSSFTEIYELQEKYSNKNSEAYNYDALEILLKNKVITSSSTKKLVDKSKIKIDNVETLIEKYKED